MNSIYIFWNIQEIEFQQSNDLHRKCLKNVRTNFLYQQVCIDHVCWVCYQDKGHTITLRGVDSPRRRRMEQIVGPITGRFSPDDWCRKFPCSSCAIFLRLQILLSESRENIINELFRLQFAFDFLCRDKRASHRETRIWSCTLFARFNYCSI